MGVCVSDFASHLDVTVVMSFQKAAYRIASTAKLVCARAYRACVITKSPVGSSLDVCV